MLSNLFPTVLSISLTTGIVSFVLLGLSRVIAKTYTAKWQYWAWLIVALRLVLPFDISLAPAPVRFSLPDARIAVPPGLPAYTAGMLPPVPLPPAAAAPAGKISFLLALGAIWFAGMVVFLLYHLISYHLFRQQALRWGRPVTNRRLDAKINTLAGAMGLQAHISVLVSAAVTSPTLTGFFRPLLLLPDDDYTDPELTLILRHELIHCKRGDVLYKLLLLLANAVHWFNPLVYSVVRKAGEAIELSCDEAVTAGQSFAFRKQYCETILNSLHHQVERRTLLSTSFYGEMKAVQERFTRILDTQRKRSGCATLAAVLAVVLLIGSAVTWADRPEGVPAKSINPSQNSGGIAYTNTQYGLKFTLPAGWEGYQIVTDAWQGLSLAPESAGAIAAAGPMLLIRHPLWTAEQPRQDIPIMVFTIAQWNALQQGSFHIGAAPINPGELGRNAKYVFALPARYNYAFPDGYEEVESILNAHPLQAIPPQG